MNRLLLILIVIVSSSVAMAQDVESEASMPADSADVSLQSVPIYAETPLLTIIQPWRYWGGWSSWDIHDGLNMQVDMGVIVGWGKRNPMRGASFFTDASLLYAKRLGSRWTFAVGGSFDRYRLWGETVNDVSIDALASYRINDRLFATGYVHHSFADDKQVPFLYPYNYYAMGDAVPGSTVVGAQLDWKINRSTSFQIGVSHVSYDNRMHTPGVDVHKKMGETRNNVIPMGDLR